MYVELHKSSVKNHETPPEMILPIYSIITLNKASICIGTKHSDQVKIATDTSSEKPNENKQTDQKSEKSDHIEKEEIDGNDFDLIKNTGELCRCV